MATPYRSASSIDRAEGSGELFVRLTPIEDNLVSRPVAHRTMAVTLVAVAVGWFVGFWGGAVAVALGCRRSSS
ncbi:MAG TPA: hypothetical protein VM925_06895 [Labilithrix sp.]|nr:hypothetical protein [Labilithrix sp.]